jgi:hypothetical protein
LAGATSLDIDSVVARDLISAFLAIALFLTAVVLVFRKRIITRYFKRIGHLSSERVAAITTGIGGILGILVTLTADSLTAVSATSRLYAPPVRVDPRPVFHGPRYSIYNSIA